MNDTLISKFDYDTGSAFRNEDMSNKLFYTFSTGEELEEVLTTIETSYKILYNKIFVLYSKQQDEYLCTYNVDFGNINNFLDNTILVHRKKETNTLYTINALNLLIKELNGGVLDTSFRIDWNNYRNCVLLTKGVELKQVGTKLHKLIEL